jgi:hypothetical protein
MLDTASGDDRFPSLSEQIDDGVSRNIIASGNDTIMNQLLDHGFELVWEKLCAGTIVEIELALLHHSGMVLMNRVFWKSSMFIQTPAEGRIGPVFVDERNARAIATRVRKLIVFPLVGHSPIVTVGVCNDAGTGGEINGPTDHRSLIFVGNYRLCGNWYCLTHGNFLA